MSAVCVSAVDHDISTFCTLSQVLRLDCLFVQISCNCIYICCNVVAVVLIW